MGFALHRPMRLRVRVLIQSALILTVGFAAARESYAQERPQEKTVATVEGDVATAPVDIDGAELLRVRGVSSLPAAERARLIRERLIAAARDPSITPESLRVVDRPTISLVQTDRDQPLVAVDDGDAALEQVDRHTLAQVHLRRIREALVTYRTARAPGALWRGVIRAAIATVIFVATLFLLHVILRPLARAVSSRFQSRLELLKSQSAEAEGTEREIWNELGGIFFTVRTATWLMTTLIFVGYVCSQFPQTWGISRHMLGFALAPFALIGTGLVNNISGLTFLAVLFVVVRLALRLIRLFFTGIEHGAFRLTNFDPAWSEPTYRLVRIVVIAFALVIAYPHIPGSDTDAFKGVSLIVGLVLSFGSSAAMANIIAGYGLIYRRVFKPGDRIKVGDDFGDVIQRRLHVTHIRSVKNEELIIPNSQIMSSPVQNFSSLASVHGLILHTKVTIGYGTPWRQVEAMLVEAARRTPDLRTDPGPFVRVKQLGEFGITYELNVYCTSAQSMERLYSALHQHVLDVFNEYGIQIMTPAYEGDTPEPKVVAPKDWYQSPAKPATKLRPALSEVEGSYR